MEFKSFMEALKGKQHKIDKNKNGKVDAHDFELLRKEESELNEGTADELADSIDNAKSTEHAKSIIAKAPTKHLQYLHHWNMGLSGARTHKDMPHIKAELTSRKAVLSAAESSKRFDEQVDLDEIHRMKTKLNSLDDISNKSIARQKLSNLKNSGKGKGALIANKMRTLNMGDDVSEGYQSYSGPSHGHAYGHSGFGRREREDDEYHVPDPVRKPQAPVAPVPDRKYIKGTPENKALKASRKPPINGMPTEEVEELDEDKYDRMLSNMVKKNPGVLKTHSKEVQKYDDISSGKELDRQIKKNPGVLKTHSAAVKKDKKMYGEDIEQIDEKSDQAKQNKTMKNMMDASRGARYKLNNPVPDASPEQKTARAHNVAIGRAMRSEAHMTTTKDKSGKLVSFKYEGDWKKSTEKKQGSGKAANLAGQGMQTMAKSQDLARARKNNMMTDEVEHIHELDQKTLKSYINKNIKSGRADDGGKGDTGLYRATNKVAGKLKTGTLDNKVKTLGNTPSNAHKNPYEYDASRSELKNRGVHHFAGRRTRTEELNMEEKDEQEYGYEGDMALNQLATLTRCAEMIKEMLKPDTDMPEWVQSKITLATDYIQTAADYMYSEMNEGKSVDIDKINTAGDVPHEEKFETFKKTKRVKESFDDEGNLISNKISYKDFITEIKLADLPSRKIQGRSYGADYSDPEGADDYDDKKPMKPAAKKRGPKMGSKRGARANYGSSKLHTK